MAHSDRTDSVGDNIAIYSPKVPQIVQIPNGLHVSKVIAVRGRVSASSKEERIIVNLCCGLLVEGSQVDNVTLHVSIRFDEGTVVLNSLIANKWGKQEERFANPFARGQPFDVRILVLSDCYRVALNGKDLCSYKHRIGIDDVKALYVKGCADLDIIEISAQELGIPLGFKVVDKANAILHPATPFVHPFPRGMKIGQTVLLTATPSANAQTFIINLRTKDDVAFHLSCRMLEEHCVRNTSKHDKWEKEEREIPFFPFMASATFDLLLLCEQDGYRVAVNGQHLFHFSHRLPFQYVDSLEISGDLRIQQVVVD